MQVDIVVCECVGGTSSNHHARICKRSLEEQSLIVKANRCEHLLFTTFKSQQESPSKDKSSLCKPPLLPAWYGLARICRAAGLVMLVSSWARLGSGSRPFLLLRIWRVKKHTSQRTKGCLVCAECVFWSGRQQPLMITWIITPVYIIRVCLRCQRRCGGEERSRLQSSRFTLKCFHLFCCQRCSWMCEHTPTQPDVNLQADICRFNLLF